MEPRIEYWPNGRIRSKTFSNRYFFHCEDGPAIQKWYSNGHHCVAIYRFNNVDHNANGPQISTWFNNGNKQSVEYRINGENHREDGPAQQEWYKNGNPKTMAYYRHGHLHSTSGPALQTWSKDGQLIVNYYGINGRRIMPEWFTQLGMDISTDFTNEAAREMVMNLFLR